MKHRWLIAMTAGIALVLVVLTFLHPYEMISPGRLSPGHAELNQDCFACHTPLLGVPAENCIACHAVADIGRKTTAGVAIDNPDSRLAFHQDLVETDCLACHIDHSGSRLAHNPHRFDHALLQPQSREQCVNCHASPDDDIHVNVTGSCADCHGSTAWKPLVFDHDSLFELEGEHDADCVSCHVDNVYREFTCYGCHEHTPENIRRRHEREGIRDFENCVECHRNAHDEPEHEGDGRRDGDD